MELNLLTLDEVSKQLKLSHNTIYKLCQTGELPARRIGHQWRILESDLVAFINRSQHDSVITSRPGMVDFPSLDYPGS